MDLQPKDTGTEEKRSQFVVFSLDKEEYAVPILAVTEITPMLDIMPVPDAPAYITGLINLRGKVVPVLDLETKFRLAHSAAANRQHIMVAENNQNTLLGVLVDQVSEVLKVPESAIRPAPEAVTSKISAEYVLGVIILGDNPQDQPAPDARMLLILDLQKILTSQNIEELHAIQSQHA
ncbi:MAG TPA: chemotaxis protein CheW [Candidatus Saccharimonadales bacterium]|nr:chemotaxis protein CheW [Candidatus Saccharimonadales bacterium]